MGVGKGVEVGTGVAVGAGVAVGKGVAVGAGVTVGVGVGVGDGLTPIEGVGVGVGLTPIEGVGVGVGPVQVFSGLVVDAPVPHSFVGVTLQIYGTPGFIGNALSVASGATLTDWIMFPVSVSLTTTL